MESVDSFDLDKIKKKYNIKANVYNTAMKYITTKVLEDIYNSYCRSYPAIQKAKDKILSEVNEVVELNKAHSIRSRIKNPEHLIEKIIRNVAKKPEKYRGINSGNYYKIITDLIGFRIMMLGREPWVDVHNHLEALFDNDESKYIDEDNFANGYTAKPRKPYIAEKPVIYLIKSDKGFYEKSDIFGKFTLRPSHQGYRSIHYTVRTSSDYYCEIQVRTIFEEGWLEFDHLIKYPYDQNNPIKNDLLYMLANIVKVSDDVIIYYNNHINGALTTANDEDSDADFISSSSDNPSPSKTDDTAKSFNERLSVYILTI